MAKCQIHCSGFGFVLNKKNKNVKERKKVTKIAKVVFFFCFFSWLDESVDDTLHNTACPTHFQHMTLGSNAG